MCSMRTINRLAFTGGLAAGIVVTKGLHEDPNAGHWGERLGTTNFRQANLPVGGTILLSASLFAPIGTRRLLRALGFGALLGAVGYGVVDPLPPVEV
jgi:hypothetical protein